METCGTCKYFRHIMKDMGECHYGSASSLIVREFQKGCKHREEEE